MWNGSITAMALWLAVIVAVFSGIALLFPGEGFDSLGRSHFSDATKAALANKPGYAFENWLFVREYDSFIPALVGTGLVFLRKRWDLLFPVILFGTSLLIHQFHRPYWYYYYLHFAIPIAWLGAFAICELFRPIWNEGRRTSDQGLRATNRGLRALKSGALIVLWSAVVSLTATAIPDKLMAGWNSIRFGENARENPVVQRMIQHRRDTKWVFTDRVIYAFHAGLPVPPELAVIPSKRIWSGQISSTFIVEKLKQYRPEQIILFGALDDERQLTEYIKTHGYQLVSDLGFENFYVRVNDGPGRTK